MRNDYLLSFLGSSRELGIKDPDTLLEMALMENDRVCVPPLDEGEVRQVWASSLRYL